jgi:hypothetical protein
MEKPMEKIGPIVVFAAIIAFIFLLTYLSKQTYNKAKTSHEIQQMSESFKPMPEILKSTEPKKPVVEEKTGSSDPIEDDIIYYEEEPKQNIEPKKEAPKPKKKAPKPGYRKARAYMLDGWNIDEITFNSDLNTLGFNLKLPKPMRADVKIHIKYKDNSTRDITLRLNAEWTDFKDLWVNGVDVNNILLIQVTLWSPP